MKSQIMRPQIIKSITKRDGTEVIFISNLPRFAMLNAFKSVNPDSEKLDPAFLDVIILVDNILSKIQILDVEMVQNIIEKTLMKSNFLEVAKSFIKYRHDRSVHRKEKDEYAKIGIDITSGADTESQRENSNVPRGTVTTQLEMIKRNYARKFADDFIIPLEFNTAHKKGEIHIHDADALITKLPNCILMDYPFMLKSGFQLGNKWIKEPNSILTVMNVMVQMVQVQSVLEFGGISLPDMDIHLGKYVLGSYKNYMVDALMDLRDLTKLESIKLLEVIGNVHPENSKLVKMFPKENKIATRKTERETYRGCKTFSYQMNTLQVRGESSPFTTIGYGTSTTWEGRLLIKCILQERLDEFELSGVQEFPKHMMSIRAGINLNKGDVNYDLFKFANKVSAKTCYPDYIFPENQENETGGSALYMGCRSLLAPWQNEKGEEIYLGRGNIGVCSVNIPRIAIESNGDFDKFWELFEERFNLAAKVVHWRYKRLITLKAKEAPFTYIGGVYGLHLDPEETIEKVFANGRGSLSLGTIGMHEACLYMLNKEIAFSDEALEFTKKMMKHINKICDQWSRDTNLSFSQYGSPSENLTDRFCRLDAQEFGLYEGITDKGFYVNSFHVNTEANITAFEKIDIESQLQKLSKGGHVGFVELNNLSGNLEAYETIVKYAHDKGCMYIGINSPWDFCKNCHWTGELKLQEDIDYTYICPKCGENDNNKIVKTVRLCGYLTTANKRAPVSGRMKEIISRVKHE